MAARRYKRPLTGQQKARLLRVIIMARAAMLEASIDEDNLSPAEYVAKHQAVYNEKDLHHQFPFIDIRGGQYASDLLKILERDIIFYMVNGDTPGGP